LTPAEYREAWQERAAILEYEGGMSRADAEEQAAAIIQNRRSPERPTLEGMDAIKAILLAGADVIGAWPNKAFIAKGEDFHAAFTAEPETVKALMSGAGDKQGRAKGKRIELFRFCPVSAAFLCLDIDRGHENETDGLAEFYAMFEHAGTPRAALPSMLRNIDRGSFPVYTTTPRGGFHLYFRYGGPEVKHSNLAPNVEIFHAGSYLTAPGSRRDGKPYVLHGSLAAAPEVPPIIGRRLPKAKAEAPKKAFFSFYRPRGQGTPTLEQIAEWTEQDGAYSGKNELCHEIALRTARDGYGYNTDQVIAFLQSYPRTGGHTQIKDAVFSAFRYMGKS
jgi:hypothetical protein